MKLFSAMFRRISVQFPTCCNVQSCRTFPSPVACQTPHIVNRCNGKKIQLFQTATTKAEEITLNGLNSAIRGEGVLRGLAGPALHIHRSRMRQGSLLRKWCRNQEPAVLPDQVHWPFLSFPQSPSPPPPSFLSPSPACPVRRS